MMRVRAWTASVPVYVAHLHPRRTVMLDWSAYPRQVQALVTEIGRAGPGTRRGYRELSDAAARKDLVGAKTRDLIALAVAVDPGAALVFSTRVVEAYAVMSAPAVAPASAERVGR